MKTKNNNRNLARNKPKKNNSNSDGNLSQNDIMPPSLIRRLNYNDDLTQKASGASYLVWRYRINDIYDPDPLVLTGSLTGYNELTAFYDNWRVEKVEVDLSVSNWEAFPLIVGAVFTTTDIVASIGSRTSALNYLENPHSTRGTVLSGKGGLDRLDKTLSLSVGSLMGNPKQYLAEIGYTGSTSSSPSLQYFVTMIVVAPSGTVLTNGVMQKCVVRYTTRFFNRKPLAQ